ncbi:MAG: hypothetical protein V1798_11630 [Pseudomonadota bacterium]
MKFFAPAAALLIALSLLSPKAQAQGGFTYNECKSRFDQGSRPWVSQLLTYPGGTSTRWLLTGVCVMTDSEMRYDPTGLKDAGLNSLFFSATDPTTPFAREKPHVYAYFTESDKSIEGTSSTVIWKDARSILFKDPRSFTLKDSAFACRMQSSKTILCKVGNPSEHEYSTDPIIWILEKRS